MSLGHVDDRAGAAGGHPGPGHGRRLARELHAQHPGEVDPADERDMFTGARVPDGDDLLVSGTAPRRG